VLLRRSGYLHAGARGDGGRDGAAPLIESETMRRAKRSARVANTNFTVLIGAGRVGKELVARQTTRSRRQGPFVAINCAALVETLIEVELFRHREGPPRVRRRGKFEHADGDGVP
jgi:transcriptional regulator with GAF, ATPase, and Fis domain